MTSPKRKNGSIVVRLVESYWQDGKVKNRILKTIGQSKDLKVVEEYKRMARKLVEEHKKGIISLSKLSEKLQIDLFRFLGKESYNNGFEDILGSAYESLGFKNLIQTGKDKFILNETLKSLVLMRVFSPSSKLRSCGLLEDHFNKKISHKQVLNMMDHLSMREEEIKSQVFHSILKGKDRLEVLLFDVTTLYFESVSPTDLKDFGYSKDGKFNEVQVVLAVLSNTEGLPLSYEIFPGNTSESGTLRDVLSSVSKKYQVQRVRVVADRAMFSEDNFKFFESWKKDQGVDVEYVISCPLRKLPVKLKKEILDLSHYKKGQGGILYYKLEYKGRQLVVTYSEKLRAKDEKKRQRLIDKLREMSCNGEISAGKLTNNRGVRKFIEKVRGKVKIDEAKIQEDRLWDGLYGVCTNKKEVPAYQLISSYRSLWKIEELFRVNKHTLRMRPIYHRLSRRIRSHIMICFLSYTTLRWTEITLQKAGLFFSPQELIDILKKVESFIIQDKIKKTGGYCVPRALSKSAQQIYSAFNKKYPTRPYKLG